MNEKKYICECGKQWDYYQSLNAHYSHCLIHRKGKKPIDRFGEKFGNSRAWSKGLTKETDERVKRISQLSSKTRTGVKRKPLSVEHKQKISLKMTENNNGYVKTKYFDVFSKYQNKIVKVQGSWELKYAEFLNKNNINWIRDRKINLRYKKSDNDYYHTYYPDFYLPDTEEFIEIKGYYWKSRDGRVDDKTKMKKIIEQNKELKIVVLEKNDLKQLGIL